MGYKYIDEKKEHLHTLDGKPLIGTSTATKVLNKPLTWWAAGMACQKFGWLNPKKHSPEEVQKALDWGYEEVMSLSKADYKALLGEAYKAHNERKEKAADEGSDRHAALEKYVKECIRENGGMPLAHSVNEDEALSKLVDWSLENVERFLWSELHCYSRELWTGGIGDVGWVDKQGRVIAGDFKSGGPYFDQFVQVAGYDLAISENGGYTKDGEKIFTLEKPVEGYCVIPFNDFKPSFVWDVKGYREAFKSCVGLHKLQDSFN